MNKYGEMISPHVFSANFILLTFVKRLQVEVERGQEPEQKYRTDCFLIFSTILLGQHVCVFQEETFTKV